MPQMGQRIVTFCSTIIVKELSIIERGILSIINASSTIGRTIIKAKGK